MSRQTVLRRVSAFAFTLLLLSIGLFSVDLVQGEGLRLETERNWETYGVGGTCIAGQHNLFVADVDGDGSVEILTGGWAYDVSESGARVSSYAPLKVWSWDGKVLFLEHTEKWNGSIGVIYAADADDDGDVEIITSGTVVSESRYSGTLRFWSWDGQSIALLGSYPEVYASSVCVADVDDDGENEVVTVGRFSNGTSRLCVWRWGGKSLLLEVGVDCCDSKTGSVASVATCDLNGDGSIEIVTAGYASSLNDSRAQVRVWQMTGENLFLQSSEEWRLVNGYALNSAGNVQGNTLVSNVKTGDVDGDGVAEVLTGGFTYDGELVAAQLRIWNWTGNMLKLETSEEWTTQDITEIKTVSVSDVDGDEKVEIVTSGGAVGYDSFALNSTEKETAHLRVWGWDGAALELEESEEWVVGEGVMAWNLATGDLNGDNVNEIVTVGCMYVGSLCDPDLRIWSVTSAPEAFVLSSDIALTIVVIGVTVSVVAVILLRRRH